MHANPHPGSELGPGQTRHETLRVLIVDDSDLVTERADGVGDNAPVHVAGEAADGVSGVSAALELDPDVVVMDWQMPRMDGVSATAAIRDRRPEIEVIAHSVSDDEQVVHDFARAGASAYVPKGDTAVALAWPEATAGVAARGSTALSNA